MSDECRAALGSSYIGPPRVYMNEILIGPYLEPRAARTSTATDGAMSDQAPKEKET
jgi:hypothetical protein